MRIAIIGGSSEDERHLGRLSEKAGHVPGFVHSRLGGATVASPGVLEHVLERLAREAQEEAGGAAVPIQVQVQVRPRALIFDAADRSDRPDAAARVLAAVRRDPYFD